MRLLLASGEASGEAEAPAADLPDVAGSGDEAPSESSSTDSPEPRAEAAAPSSPSPSSSSCERGGRRKGIPREPIVVTCLLLWAAGCGR